MLRRRLLATLTLLALAGAARAQSGPGQPSNVPALAPPVLDAIATPLTPQTPDNGERPIGAHKVIATSQPGPSRLTGLVPVPDDGLPAGSSSTLPAPRVENSPTNSVRTAVYRPDIDGGRVELARGQGDKPSGGRAVPQARLDLQVEGPSAVTPGKPFVYVIRVRSSGTATAGAVRIADRLPVGASLIGAEPKPEIAGDRLSWDLGDLAPAAERVVTVTLDAEKSSAFQVRPVASFSGAAALRVAPARPLLELKLVGPESAPPGASVPYRVQVANNGSAALQRVLVSVKLSPGLRHPSLGRSDTIEADLALAAGETKTLPLDLRAGDAGMNGIAARVRANDGSSAEVRAAVLIDPAAPAVPQSSKVTPQIRAEISNLSDAVAIEATAIYEIRLTNAADVAQTGVRLLAEMTEGLEPDQADGPTAWALARGGVVFETLRRMQPGESVVYHLRARARRAGVQQVRVEVNADHQAQPTMAEVSTWVAPGRGR